MEPDYDMAVSEEICPPIRRGDKRKIIRYNYDYGMEPLDVVSLVKRDGSISELVGYAIIKRIKMCRIKDLCGRDFVGHTTVQSSESVVKMLDSRCEDEITVESVVKVIHFAYEETLAEVQEYFERKFSKGA